MGGEVSKPHDHLFRSVFGEDKEPEAASLLQAYLPPAVSGELLWSSLKWQPASFIDDRLRDSESDLLYAIRGKGDGAAAWLYVLLEHQSTPDPWLRLRLLKYSIRIWERDRRRHPDRWHRFAEAVRSQVPGGGELMNKTEEMIKIYGDTREREGRQEGRQEGELRGKVHTIAGLVGRDVPWSTIEAATGIDEATFDRLKRQLDTADGGAAHSN